jgi:hypothetical protein
MQVSEPLHVTVPLQRKRERKCGIPFAIGDVEAGSIECVAAAVGEGASSYASWIYGGAGRSCCCCVIFKEARQKRDRQRQSCRPGPK